MKRSSFAVALLLCFGVFGQGAESVVTVKAVPPAGALQPGKPAVLTLELTIREEFHINSDKPLEDNLIPTTVVFKEHPGLAFGKPVFPPAPLKKLPVSEKPMSVYEHGFKITTEITAAPAFSEKEVAVEGNVRYQACNNKTCLRPTTAAFSVVLPVATGGAGAVQSTTLAAAPAASTAAPAVDQIPATLEPVQSAAVAPAASAGTASDAAKSSGIDFGGQSLFWTMVLVFLGGLALNLTPCVYPMIPITISYFGGQSQGKKGSLVLHSFLYVIGMATTYSVLGSIAAMTGSLFGSALRYPPVLIGIALIMILLALSMFDVYELQMPAFLNRLAGSSHKGFFGTYFMGLTVGIVAAPCIGPFVLGLLTYVGNRGSALLGFSLFFVLALGLGVPFLFLGVFSGSLSRMPRSGAWMIWVRTIFGFVLIAMAIYFLRPLFPSELLYHLTFALTMLLGGIYMAWIEPTQAKGKGFIYLRNVVGLVFFGIALYLSFNGVEAYVDDAIVSKAQTMSGGSGGSLAGVIQWAPYSDAKLAEAASSGKPVLIDFFADWCLPCKELDKKTFSTPEVIAASKDFVMLKVDLTSADDPKGNALQEKYQIKGVPSLLFLKPGGQELANLRVTGFEEKEVFFPKMQQALQSNRSAQ